MGRRRRHRRARAVFTFDTRPSPFRARVTSRRWTRRVVAAVIIVVMATGAAVAWGVHRSVEARSRHQLEQTVDSYLEAWSRSDWKGMAALSLDPGSELVAAYRQMSKRLHVSKLSASIETVDIDGSTATAAFEAHVTIGGLGEWSYAGSLALSKESNGDWRVRWSPSAVHPLLRPGFSWVRTREWPERAPILARNGQALTVVGDVVTVGVEPGKIDDRARVLDALKAYTGVDPKTVTSLLDRPGVKPNAFIPVITLRRSRYDLVRSALYPVPGVFFRAGTARILLEEGFAQQVLGRVREATAEDLQRLGAPYEAGDTVGAYGLELAFEQRLAGTPSGAVELVDRKTKKPVRILHRFEGHDGKALRTTLDVTVQRAAEDALRDLPQPSALVAINPRNGNILAVVSHPSDGPERALSGRYPPGSTFKIVTAAALIGHGLGLDDTTSCPREVNAGGKVFTNFEGESFGSITFREAFARSCNTAFIKLASTLPRRAIGDMAERFGFGAKYLLDVPAFGGSYPQPADDAERAASAIGQGRVEASPVHMASVAAAVANGTWRLPRLISANAKIAETPLSGVVAANLRQLMGLVATQGTAVGAGLPKGVAGKTGTAEFGNQGNTHAWFVGYRGDLAFAVLVEGGGVGGRVAAPIAADFLDRLDAMSAA